MALARVFALVRLIRHSPLIFADRPYKILDVATRACIIFLHGCFHSKSPVEHSVFYFIVNVKRHVDFIQNGINWTGTVIGYAVSPQLTSEHLTFAFLHRPAFY